MSNTTAATGTRAIDVLRERQSTGRERGALPNLVVIGAMKCGTSALHRYLDRHPEIAMSEPKELNFFFDAGTRDRAAASDEGRHGLPQRLGALAGNWQRGTRWYARHFRAEATVRGESSPGYTSPAHRDVAQRMAAVIPAAKLIFLVRDPLDRAVSQYRHHRKEGMETRSVQEALLDSNSQYIARGRYYERLSPFLRHYMHADIAVISREELLTERRKTMRSLFTFLGVDEGFWSSDLRRLWHSSRGSAPPLDTGFRRRMAEAFGDDPDRLRHFAGREFPGWTV